MLQTSFQITIIMTFVKGLAGVCLLLLATPEISSASTATDGKGSGNETSANVIHGSYLFLTLEDALIKETESLYTLRESLLSKHNHVLSVHIVACVTMATQNCSSTENVHESETGSSSSCVCSKCFDYQWSSSAVLDSISLEQLVTIDNSLAPVLIWYITGRFQSKVKLCLHLDKVRYQPSDLELSQTLAKVLRWVRA